MAGRGRDSLGTASPEKAVEVRLDQERRGPVGLGTSRKGGLSPLGWAWRSRRGQARTGVVRPGRHGGSR